MFHLDQFVEDCKGKSASAVKELLEDALRDLDSVKQALAGVDKEIGQGSIGDMALYKSPQLTVLKAAVPAGFKSPPHDHRMWAVIGVYEGQENNIFYRRSGDSLEPAGGKELKTSDVVVLGEDAVHAIANPLDQTSYAIHVYGGNLPDVQRSMWNPFSLKEEPCEYEGLVRYARQLMGKEEPRTAKY